MAQFYFRTREEFVEDGMLCAEECEHLDCADLRDDLQAKCMYCGKSPAGRACMFDEGRLVHMVCVVKAVEAERTG